MSAQDQSGDTSQTTVDQLIKLGREADLFHDAEREAYATAKVGGHRETYRIGSPGFKLWLDHRLWREHGKTADKQVLQRGLDALKGQAIHDGPRRQVGLRLTERDGAIWLDLADDEWRAVKITADGWEMVCNPPVRFRRPGGMKALPAPEHGGSLKELRKLMNIPDDGDWALVQAWLLGSLCPHGPYPILIVNGEQGSAKSTLCRMLRSLVDPNAAPLRAAPRSSWDLMLAARHSWLLAFDNLSGLRSWLSDDLCRVATGGGQATRQLYTDTDEIILCVVNPVLMNGIDDLAARPDLLSRSICLTLPRIAPSARRTEEEVWREFEQLRPRILGALLDAVSRAMRHVRTVSLESYPRMADFAKWVVAGEGALDVEPGAFLAAYEENALKSHIFAVEASPIGGPIQILMATQPMWKGTAAELLEKLSFIAAPHIPRYGWPQNAKDMGSTLRRLAPSLCEAFGIEVRFIGRKGKDRRRIIVLEKSDTSCTAPSASPACDTSEEGQQDGSSLSAQEEDAEDDETDDGKPGAK